VGSTRSESRLVLNARARTVSRYAAESGIVAAVALLEQRIAAGTAPGQEVLAWTEINRDFNELADVPLGHARFGVQLTNLSGRLDLNQAQPEVLAGLFSQFTSPQAASALVDALLDWRDPDDLVRPRGAEADDYRRAGSPYVPHNAPLTRMDELRRVKGMTEPLALALEPYLTVNGDLRIDVNGASESVLAAIPGLGPTGARAIVSRRKGGGLFSSLTEVQAFLGRRYGGRTDAAPIAGLAVSPSRLLLLSRGWVPGHPLTHEIQAAYAVVGQRLRLQSWRERDQ
jgi:general secretion pathway protein K